MEKDSELFVGLDTSKLKISVAVADGERNGEVRFFGDISAEPKSVASMVTKLAKQGAKLHFCYEAGPTGYELYRQIIELGHCCEVVAPSLIPRRPGDRVKTNRRDAVSLARLHRAGELTAVWVPDETHEAIRDLVRAREKDNGYYTALIALLIYLFVRADLSFIFDCSTSLLLHSLEFLAR